MTRVSLNPSFKASLNPALEPPAPYGPIWAKVAKVACDIFSVLIFPIGIARLIGWGFRLSAKMAVLPSHWLYWAFCKHAISRNQHEFDAYCFGEITDYNREFRANYNVQRAFVETPDQAKLHTVYFQHKEATSDTPTIFLVSSNAALLEQRVYRWLIDKALERKSVVNFLVFDYRGVSRSKGTLSKAEDLVVDADSVYQYAVNKLKIPPENLRIYGWSMGGAVGANLKALHPEMSPIYVSERSYSSLNNVLFSLIPKPLRCLFFWLPNSLKDWNLEVPYQKLKDLPLIVYHDQDPTIPLEASFFQGAVKTSREFSSLQLAMNPPSSDDELEEIDHHTEPLDFYTSLDKNSKNAAEEIASYILPPSSTFKSEQCPA